MCLQRNFPDLRYTHTKLVESMRYLINRESNAEVLDSHLLLLASVLLHESNETGTLSISVVIFEEVDDELRVFGEGGVVTTTSGRLLQPAARLDHSVPTLH